MQPRKKSVELVLQDGGDDRITEPRDLEDAEIKNSQVWRLA